MVTPAGQDPLRKWKPRPGIAEQAAQEFYSGDEGAGRKRRTAFEHGTYPTTSGSPHPGSQANSKFTDLAGKVLRCLLRRKPN